MSTIDFKVGKEEVHNISFKMNRISWRFKVTVDGNPMKKGTQFFIGLKEVKFDVGEKERHKIWINWYTPLFGVVRTWEAKVFIDDTLYNTYKL